MGPGTSRDNVPARDEWNRHCVQVTAELLVEALHWLRDHDALDVSALQCMPMDETKFPDHAMFRPMYDTALEAFRDEELLPAYGGGYVSAVKAPPKTGQNAAPGGLAGDHAAWHSRAAVERNRPLADLRNGAGAMPVRMMYGRREIAVRFPDEGATMPFRKRGSYLNGGCDTLRQHRGELR